MIKRLQRKFILIAGFSLLVVLATIVGSIYGVAAYRSHQEVNSVLNMLVENDGQISPSFSDNNHDRPFLTPQQSREGIYQYRFFSAQLSKKGKVQQIDNQHIFTVSPQDIVSIAQRAYSRHQDKGQIYFNKTMYAYQVKHKAKATIIVFLDESLLEQRSKDLAKIAIWLGIIVMVMYTIVLAIFSRRAIKPVVEGEIRQREFISNAGHELKTPLTVISANTEMQELLDGENEWTKSNKQQVARLTHLINNLIALAKIGEQPDLHIVELDASAITNQVVDSFKPVIQQSGFTFKTDIQQKLTVKADENRFTELINILLDNANKYCDENGKIFVNLHRNKRSRAVTLSVTNSYAKGADVDYSKFFERFYRADTAHQVKGQTGFGIGLSMAQRIVADFHGKIKAKYSNGMISFIVTLKA
ncbi:sensor histidine kinase [Limosilactobacillus secaliphilus]|uniref:histidine kinase n=1 Tax=Limosilactobacillus secaliphilus TaxID=396268 RepID=A0A0R2HZS7_9LACO|nr:HAMP domain-containing sensor histidine kinase [Limosilactobacillus secaliphilus]KRN58377.1 two-component system histidine kinase [Limosilactobacillus secaliphilus]